MMNYKLMGKKLPNVLRLYNYHNAHEHPTASLIGLHNNVE